MLAAMRHASSRFSEASISAPHVLEADRAQFGIAGCVLDSPVPEPILDQPRVMARIGHRIAAGMAEHVGVDQEGESGALTDTLHKAVDGVGGERPAALGRQHERRWRLLVAFEPPQRPQLDAAQRMNGWRAGCLLSSEISFLARTIQASMGRRFALRWRAGPPLSGERPLPGFAHLQTLPLN